jgi:2-polyprenyl-6-methoxyphenol hydroxylase-like FAD-dependent oxidoreductase
MNNTIPQEKKALVIGGGIAGLLAARVLSEHYDDVLVIERDDCPEKPGSRPGAPQSFHLHQVLPGGEMLMEQLFPGFHSDLLELGAFQARNAGVQMVNVYGTIPFPGAGDDKGAVTYSRGLLEWVLRQRVQALPSVRFLYHQEVIALETAAGGTRVTGVRIRERGQLEQQAMLAADLVVDASGRSSKVSPWLSALGYTLPADERVGAGIGYSTRYYKIPPHLKDIAVIVIEGDPTTGKSTGGVLKAIENDTWAVCLASVGGQYPPIDARGFEQGLASLVSPLIADAVRDAEPLTEPRGYRLAECIRHHYEQMEQWPAGLLVLGDAFCYFDPVYGQGMTLAAIEADTLATCLREEQGQFQSGFELRVLQRMQEAIYPAWWRSAIEDLRWPGVVHSGPEPLKNVALLHRYFDLCLKQSTRKIVQQMQTGNFNPQSMSYFMMNWLFVSPRDVINTDMLAYLLEEETPEEKQAALDTLFEGYDQRNSAALLDEIVPSFTCAFSFSAQAPSSGEEGLLTS